MPLQQVPFLSYFVYSFESRPEVSLRCLYICRMIEALFLFHKPLTHASMIGEILEVGRMGSVLWTTVHFTLLGQVRQIA